MKRFLSAVLAGVMALSLMAGCSSGGEETTTTESGNDTTAESTGLFPAVAKEDLKVGVVHITDPAEGTGYTYTHDLGIQGMQKNLGLDDSQIIRKNNVDDTDATKIRTALEECVEEGCQIVFATSWGYMDYVEEIAEEYPDVLFAHGTGYKSNGKNFINYFGKINQARYLSGIAAGMKTTSNKIGYVAAQNNENGEVTSGIDAFAMGVESVNPDAKVYVKVTGSWFDPEGEGQAAKSLIDMGCDVIAQHCDTANPATEAEKAGVFAVGYNSDMAQKAPGATLTSVMWDWSVFYTEAVQKVIDGTWDGRLRFHAGRSGNSGSCSDLCAKAPQKIRKLDKIISGEWDIFDGTTEYEDNQGQTHTLKAEDYGTCNWYYKNVEVA
ncbi:BMP family ABC transporter substrate-binding protein [Butyricicoccus pullicaecorum]|uniref:BMP family ABC transporter substrate-binding protein n=1 Tax=Butyricicoccus pullicaecorum TaxID=501571 RepID=UPI003990959D